MPFPIVPPQSVPFLGSINTISVFGGPEPSARRSVSLNILWSTDSGANNAVSVNVGSQQIVTLSQIRTLYVDNSQCSVDVFIYFADTQFRLTIAANSVGYYPVLTNLLNFVLWTSLPISATDYTICNILNYDVMPLELAAPLPVINTSTIPINVTAAGTYTHNLATSGIVRVPDLQISATGTLPAAADTVTISLQDTATHPIVNFLFTNLTGLTYLPLCDMHSTNIASDNGLLLSVVATGGGVMALFVTFNLCWTVL